MTVLYADDVLAVCLKPAGVLSEDKGAQCVPALLRGQLQKDMQCVHRLDRAVGIAERDAHRYDDVAGIDLSVAVYVAGDDDRRAVFAA